MIDKINHWLIIFVKVVSGCALVFMAGIAFVDATGRQMHMPLLGAYEYVKLALMTFFFASIGLVVKEDSQIRVGLLAELYKPRLARIEKYFTLVVEVLALVVLSWMIFDQASRLARFGTVSTFFRIPMAPWVYLAAAMSVIAVWFGVQNVWRAFRKEEQPRPNSIPGEEN